MNSASGEFASGSYFADTLHNMMIDNPKLHVLPVSSPFAAPPFTEIAIDNPSLLSKLQNRAKSALFIDLRFLRKIDLCYRGEEVKLGSGVLFVKTSPKEVTLGEEWGILFLLLIELYTHFFPHMAAKMRRYYRWVMQAAMEKAYSWSSLIEYDKRWRMLHQGPDASYGVLDLSIASLTLFSPTLTSPRAVSKHPVTRMSDQKKVCYTWLNGKPCKKVTCPFRHKCVDCPGKLDHDPKTCPRKRKKP